MFTEVPSTLTHTNARFSTYKNHTTVKCLVAIAPGGWFTFVSASVLVKLTIGKCIKETAGEETVEERIQVFGGSRFYCLIFFMI